VRRTTAPVPPPSATRSGGRLRRRSTPWSARPLAGADRKGSRSADTPVRRAVAPRRSLCRRRIPVRGGPGLAPARGPTPPTRAPGGRGTSPGRAWPRRPPTGWPSRCGNRARCRRATARRSGRSSQPSRRRPPRSFRGARGPSTPPAATPPLPPTAVAPPTRAGCRSRRRSNSPTPAAGTSPPRPGRRARHSFPAHPPPAPAAPPAPRPVRLRSRCVARGVPARPSTQAPTPTGRPR
jgi:hypothetical protein